MHIRSVTSAPLTNSVLARSVTPVGKKDGAPPAPELSYIWFQQQRNIHKEPRILAETNNFFVVNALGAFHPGYLLLIPKQSDTSIANSLHDQNYDELKFLLNLLQESIKAKYNSEVLVFEHGSSLNPATPSCACVRVAHLHLVAIPKGSDVPEAIQNVLLERTHGIQDEKEAAVLRASGVEAIQAHNEFKGFDKTKWTACNNYPQDLPSDSSYVYIDGPGGTFLSEEDLGSQFGRQVAHYMHHREQLDALGFPQSVDWDWRIEEHLDNHKKTIPDLLPILRKNYSSCVEYGFKLIQQ